MSELEKALAIYDAKLATCPFNGEGRAPPVNKPCPKCGASGSEACGIDSLASYKFIETARKIAIQD